MKDFGTSVHKNGTNCILLKRETLHTEAIQFDDLKHI